LGFPLTKQLKNVFPYFAISLLVFGEAMLCSHFIPNDLLSILASLVVCAGTYYFLSRALKLYAYNEAIGYYLTLRKR